MARTAGKINWFGKIILGLFGLTAVVVTINYFSLLRTDDRLPNLDESYDSHVFLAARGYGHSFSLTGDVMVTVMFVDDPDNTWTQEGIERLKSQVEEANSALEDAAEEYGAELNLQVRYLECRVDIPFTYQDYKDWAVAATETTGHSMAYCSSSVEDEYGVKEAPYMLCTPQSGRAFARAVSQDGYFEYGILYADGAAYAHELCHLFGAEDYYYPQEVEELAKDCLGKSLMLDSSEMTVDPLTAYLIGWTDELTSESMRFIDETAWITENTRYLQYAEESYTGEGTKAYDGAVYTGRLVRGVPNGQGKLEYEDGTCYEGEFKNGVREGYGKYSWPSGNAYEGNFANNVFNGIGKYTWAEGNVYEGQFVEGKFQGIGKYTWADGTYYEGEFFDNRIHGQGKQVSPNGRTITGTWNNGEYVQ